MNTDNKNTETEQCSIPDASKRFLAIGTLASGKSFRYSDTAYDMEAFIQFLKSIYPDFVIDSITEI